MCVVTSVNTLTSTATKKDATLKTGGVAYIKKREILAAFARNITALTPMKDNLVHALTLWLAFIGCCAIVYLLHGSLGLPGIFNYMFDFLMAAVAFSPVVLQYFSWMELHTHAKYDTLTGIFNRNSFNQHFERFLRQEKKFQLVMIDLVKFKSINDTHGHRVGDEVLKTVGARLHELTRPDDVSARLGGDEFVLLVPGELSDADYINLIRKIEAPMLISGIKLKVGLSVGVSTYPDNGIEPSTLMHQADVAMYHAKKNGFSVYSGTPDYLGETRARNHAGI